MKKIITMFLSCISLFCSTNLLTVAYADNTIYAQSTEYKNFVINSSQYIYNGTIIEYKNMNWFPIDSADNFINKKLFWKDNCLYVSDISDTIKNNLFVEVINTDVTYSIEANILNDIPIIYNNNNLTNTDVIKYNNEIYIPIRTICSIGDKNISWDNFWKAIFINNNMTQKNYDDAEKYINDMYTHIYGAVNSWKKLIYGGYDEESTKLINNLSYIIEYSVPEIAIINFNYSEIKSKAEKVNELFSNSEQSYYMDDQNRDAIDIWIESLKFSFIRAQASFKNIDKNLLIQ